MNGFGENWNVTIGQRDDGRWEVIVHHEERLAVEGTFEDVDAAMSAAWRPILAAQQQLRAALAAITDESEDTE